MSASLNLRMKHSPVEGWVYAVSTEPIGTSSMAPNSSEKGFTLTVWPVVDSILQLEPAHIVSACESNSLVLVETVGTFDALPMQRPCTELNIVEDINLVTAEI